MQDHDLMTDTAAAVFPKAVEGMGCWEYIKNKKQSTYSIGSPVVDRYIRATEANREPIMLAVGMMDGTNSLESIEKRLEEEHRIKMPVGTLYQKLCDAGLIDGVKGKEELSETEQMGVKLLDIEIKEASDLTKKIWKGFWYFFTGLYLITIPLTLILSILKFDKFKTFFDQSYTFRDSYLWGALVAAVISVFSITIHECSHAAAAVRFGLQPSRFKMILYGGYQANWVLKIRGIYTVCRKYRILILLAGLITNLSISVMCIGIYLLFDMSPTVVEVYSKLFASNLIMGIGVASPFYLSDGYFVMSQLLGVSNLRTRILALIPNLFRKNRPKESPLLYAYAVVMLALVAFGICYTGVWAYNMSKELYGLVSVKGLNYMLMAIPWMFYGITIGLFIKRWYKIFRQGEKSDA